MLAHSEKLYKELETQLKSISLGENGALRKAELSISICDKILADLKELVLANKFKNQQEEIFFFKKIKPKFSSQLIYNAMLYDLESKRPVANNKTVLSYLESIQGKLDAYFKKNTEFCTYYRTDSTLFDDKYFVRDKMDLRLVMNERFFSYDREFSTNRDIKLARLIANEMLSVHIAAEIKRIEAEQIALPATQTSGLTWTENKVNLVLLIYAFQTASCFNGGNVDIKELAQKLSEFWNIELSDIYRTWAEIKLRKNPTKFLDALKLAIENRISTDMK